jgi:chaperonin GroES
MRLKPVGHRMVVKPYVRGKYYENTNILRPEDQQSEFNEGKVLRLADLPEGVQDAPAEVGDHIVYTSYGGTEMSLHGEDYLILEYKHVLAIVEPAS